MFEEGGAGVEGGTVWAGLQQYGQQEVKDTSRGYTKQAGPMGDFNFIPEQMGGNGIT